MLSISLPRNFRETHVTALSMHMATPGVKKLKIPDVACPSKVVTDNREANKLCPWGWWIRDVMT